MRYNDPNRPEPIKPERAERPGRGRADDTETPDIEHLGYDRVARRPKGRMVDEIIPEERADRIEGIFGDQSPFGMDSY